MTLYYFDTSALVKYYVLEPGSTWVREIVNALEAPGEQRAHLILISEITVPEVAAAFAVVHRTGRIRRPVWDYVFDQFMDDVSWRFQLIKVDRDDFLRAALLTRNHPLKGYDGVQLAVALRADARLAPADVRQRRRHTACGRSSGRAAHRESL
jgi:predicted nucleic acid-binding protein